MLNLEGLQGRRRRQALGRVQPVQRIRELLGLRMLLKAELEKTFGSKFGELFPYIGVNAEDLSLCIHVGGRASGNGDRRASHKRAIEGLTQALEQVAPKVPFVLCAADEIEAEVETALKSATAQLSDAGSVRAKNSYLTVSLRGNSASVEKAKAHLLAVVRDVSPLLVSRISFQLRVTDAPPPPVSLRPAPGHSLPKWFVDGLDPLR